MTLNCVWGKKGDAGEAESIAFSYKSTFSCRETANHAAASSDHQR